MKIFFTLLLVFLFSCSSTPKFPGMNYASMKDSERGDAEKLAYLYHQAINNQDNNASCKKYKTILESKDFPLKQLVEIRSMEVCDLSDAELINLWENQKKYSRWIKKTYYEVSYKMAKSRKMKKYIGRFSYRLSFYSKRKKEKEEFLLEAIRLDTDKKFNALARKRLDKISPRYRTAKNKKDLFQVGHDYEKNREFRKARQIYFKIIKKRGLDLKYNIKLFNRIRFSYKKELNKDKYELYSKKLYQYLKREKGKSKQHLEAFFKYTLTYVRVLWTRGFDPKAEKVLGDTLKVRGMPRLTKSKYYWIQGGIKKGQKKLKISRKLYQKALRTGPKGGVLYQKLVWNIGFSYYLDEMYKEAANFFEKQIKSSKDMHLKNKLLFWHAKSLQSLNKVDDAEDIFEDISNDSPYSYYGILSKKELNIPFLPLDPKHDISPTEYPIFEWLLTLNETEIAKRFLASKKKTLGILPLYNRVGFYNRALSTFFSLSRKAKGDLTSEAPILAYPLAFHEKIKSISGKYEVSPNLLLAISRQESGFNPYARSYADAFGLMQLLPSKAKMLSRNFKIPYQHQDDLYDPQINIQLGAALFKNLKEEFENKFPFYVAAYNAGSNAVRTWIKERYSGDILEFIEQIPYRETQLYVKIVLRNYIVYQQLQSSDEFLFPKDIF